MPVKKDRDRFSVKFNLNDPLHEAAVRLLEQQGPRRKAQFIANAILHYMNCPETPKLEYGQQVDRTCVETMVLEILQQQGLKANITEEIADSNTTKNVKMRRGKIIRTQNRKTIT